MRTAILRLVPPDGGLHPADGEVAAHASLEPEAIDLINVLDDGTGVVLCRIRGGAAAPARDPGRRGRGRGARTIAPGVITRRRPAARPGGPR